MLRILMLSAAAVIGLSGAASAQDYSWKPSKPVRIIVPWGAGGSTDQLVRALAADLGDELKQAVVVVNQTGGAGAVGTKAALDAPHDGYTWTAGASKDLGTYIVTGAIDTHLKDWQLYLATVNYTVLSVNPNSKFKSVEDIAAAMKDRRRRPSQSRPAASIRPAARRPRRSRPRSAATTRWSPMMAATLLFRPPFPVKRRSRPS